MAKPEPCLRLARPEDVESIHRLFCLPEVYQYLADGQAPPVQIAHDWVEASPLDHDRFAGGLWLLHDPSTLQLMGLSRLHAEDTRALELTFLLDPIFWGQGWATRMAHTIIMYAFHSGFVSLVWAGADEPNLASIKVMERLGMQYLRKVQYPAGLGLEYCLRAEKFDPDRFLLLPLDLA